MTSVEYLRSTARLKESILNCESERLNLEQRLKAIKNGPSGGGSSAALSSYYRDLCEREASMQSRAQTLLDELSRSETSLRGLSRRAQQLRARRDEIIGERAPHWRDEVIETLRRRTSTGGAAPASLLLGESSVAAATATSASAASVPPPPPPEPQQRISAIDEDEDLLEHSQQRSLSRRSQDVSDLTLAGLAKLLDFIDSEMERAQPRILAAYYASSAPSDALRDELCRAANGPGGLPSHVSAVSATCLVREELELVVATRLPGGCVFPDRMVAGLSAVRDAGQLERQIDMNLGDEARSLWRRLLSHMRRLVRRSGRSSGDVARLFCPALLHHSAASLDGQLALLVARILDLPAAGAAAASAAARTSDDEDDEEESVTIASDRMPPQRPTPVAESMLATAGSFVDEEDDDDDEAPAAAGTTGGGGDGRSSGLNVTRNPELRASASDAHVRAYAAALQDDSADESSVTELTLQSGTNRSGLFSHNSPQPNLKDSNAYQKMLHGALGASANLGKSSDAAGAAAATSKPWMSQELVKDDHDLESDIDSELENSFRLRLSGGGTLKSRLAATATAQQLPPTHKENEDEDFGEFYD